MSPPNCKKCGEDHWPFKRCEEVSEPKAKRAPVTIRQPLPEHLREWGSRFATVEQRGTSFLQPRTTPLETGSVTYPDGSDAPK